MDETKEFEASRPQLRDFPYILLVQDVLKRWLGIVVVTVLVGIGIYIVNDMNFKPVYRTDATLVVTTRDSTTTVYSNLDSTKELASVFSKLLNSSVMRNTIVEELGLPGFDGSITASQIVETNLVTIQVTATDPRTAFLVMESVIEKHWLVTEEVVGDIVLEVLQLPQVATAPANTFNMSRRVRTAMLLAALLSCAGIMVISYSRDTVRSREEAERKLRCWCLGEIPHEKRYKTLADLTDRRKSSLIITNPATSFQFVETIRRLRRRVEQYMADGRVLMVTSMAENEGKSTIAVNLALALSQKHEDVLLVDLDLRKPACWKILSMKGGGYGTIDVLSGRTELAQAVAETPGGSLSVLPERLPASNAERYLRSEQMQSMLRTARARYRYVILDMPPMSVAPDVEYMMEYADDALLVVRQNQACARELNKAISVLEGGNAKLLGCVLNNVYTSGISSGGSYGHGYGKYGSYGRYGKAAPRKTVGH